MASVRSIREIYKIRELGTDYVQPYHVPIFFDLFTIFVNLNQKAQKYISGSKLIIFLKVNDVGDFVVRIENNIMSWNRGSPESFTLKLEMDLKVGVDVILRGDAVTPYMAGNIKLYGENAEENALYYHELIQMYLEFLNLRSF